MIKLQTKKNGHLEVLPKKLLANSTPEAVALRMAATAFGQALHKPPNDDDDSAHASLNRKLLKAAIAYAKVALREASGYVPTEAEVRANGVRIQKIMAEYDKGSKNG